MKEFSDFFVLGSCRSVKASWKRFMNGLDALHNIWEKPSCQAFLHILPTLESWKNLVPAWVANRPNRVERKAKPVIDPFFQKGLQPCHVTVGPRFFWKSVPNNEVFGVKLLRKIEIKTFRSVSDSSRNARRFHHLLNKSVWCGVTKSISRNSWMKALCICFLENFKPSGIPALFPRFTQNTFCLFQTPLHEVCLTLRQCLICHSNASNCECIQIWHHWFHTSDLFLVRLVLFCVCNEQTMWVQFIRGIVLIQDHLWRSIWASHSMQVHVHKSRFRFSASLPTGSKVDIRSLNKNLAHQRFWHHQTIHARIGIIFRDERERYGLVLSCTSCAL